MDKLKVMKIVPENKGNDLAWMLIKYDDKSIFEKLLKQAVKGKVIYALLKGEKRSNDANSYMWVLCDKIAKKLNSMGQNETKLTVYRRAIEDIGTFEDIPIKDIAKEKFIETWQDKGVGWLAKELRESKSPGYVVIRLYYGSSSYDSYEMKALVDYIVGQAQELNINTIQEDELQSLIKEWGNEKAKKD